MHSATGCRYRDTRAQGLAVSLACVITVLLWSGFVVSPAWAGYELVGKFPRVSEEVSLGALPLSPGSTGVATDDATGEVYVADGAHARIERFDSEGGFLGAWGWNVIRTGPGKAGTSLEEVVKIKRTSGGEDVIYNSGGYETKPLSYEAEANVVEEELAGTPIESETEGRITGEIKVVKEGLGVYRFTYGGALGDELAAPIRVEKAGLEGEIVTEIVNQGSPAFEDCVIANGDICRKPKYFGTRGGSPGEFFSPRSVAVDQATGDVYVLDPSEHPTNAVQVFTTSGERTGVECIGSTTEKLGKVEETEKNPEMLRDPTGIAVDTDGNLYIVDQGTSYKEESRIAVFDSTCKYLGSLARKCGVAFEKGCGLAGVGVDSAGDVYTIGQEETVYEFQRGSEPNRPVCESPRMPHLGPLAVDGQGEVVAYGNGPNKFYWFAACEHERLEEEPVRDFENKVVPPANDTTAIAWNPTLRYGAGRAEGVFYEVNPAFKNPETELNTGLIFAPPVVAGATCTGNSGTIRLSPGLTGTPAVQTVKVKGALTGCTGEPFTEVKYTATLKTARPVSCAVLGEAGRSAAGPAKYRWTPKAKISTGTLTVPLTEASDVQLLGEVTTGAYSPLTFIGTSSESFTGGATCGEKVGKRSVKAVEKGIFG
jgi:hypothetical protein